MPRFNNLLYIHGYGLSQGMKQMKIKQGRDTQGSFWEACKCKASFVFSHGLRMQCLPTASVWQYTWGMANQGSSPNLCCPVFLGLPYIGVIDWLASHMVDLRFQRNDTAWPNATTSNHMVDTSDMSHFSLRLPCVASSTLRSCVAASDLNKDSYQILHRSLYRSQRKGQMSLGARPHSILHS